MSTVIRFSIAPIRSLGLEHPTEIDLTPLGVAEDRRFYLIDDAGLLVDRIVTGTLVQASAHTDRAGETLRVDLPDGTVIAGAVRLGEAVETALHGRTAVGHLVVGPWGEALSPLAGRRVRVVRCDRIGGTRSQHPATLVTHGSLAALARQSGVEAIDPRRFRMLIDLDGDEPHGEDRWIGGRIALGETILRISGPVPRCAITTHDPDTGYRDMDTLRTILAYRGPGEDRKPMFGVYGEVERPGRIRLGDEVSVLQAG